LAGYTPGQRRVIRALDREADQRGYRGRRGRTLRLAAYETGLTESNLLNLGYGDGSSVNWRQETASSYPNVDRMDLRGSVDRFFDEAEAAYSEGIKPGVLSQAVQRSAFPGRYAEHREQALDLLAATRRIDWPGGVSSGGSSRGPGVSPRIERDAVQAEAGMSALMRALNAASEPAPIQGAPLAAPAFSAAPTLPSGYQAPASSGGPAPPKPELSELMALVQPGSGLPESRLVPGENGALRGGGGGGRSSSKSLSGIDIAPDGNHGAMQLAKWAAGDFYTSGERTPENNAAVGGSATSDHLTTNRWASAADMKYGVGRQVARRLGLRNWKPGTYDRHIITVDGRRYSVQLLEDVEGHYTHTHLGIQRVR
jgi:hypothetical protein